MLAKSLEAGGLALLITLCACQQNKKNSSSDTKFSQSVLYLDPNSPENQLANESAYGQVIVTADNDDVIKELTAIPQIHDAVQEVYFVKSNNSFESVVYIVQFKRNINPIPYYNFFQGYEGVVGVEFDGIVGLAGSDTVQEATP